MCGLSLYCSTQFNPIAELKQSLARLQHRGPDASGCYFQKIENYFIGLGHNRLSIIDVSDAGHQPMNLGMGTTLIYNGEVYNHVELRAQVQQRGYTLKGHSDTEVVLMLYTIYGTDAFAMLKGMFAFALLDENNKKLFLVRDHIGIKPLYLYERNEELFASSEIRGLNVFPDIDIEVDPNDVFEFFNQGFLYEPSTGYSNIKKLMPGHYLELDLATGKRQVTCYSKKIQREVPVDLKLEINTAIQQQLIADVPLGIFFSGGIDSSIIASGAPQNDLFFAQYHQDKTINVDEMDDRYAEGIAQFLNKEVTRSVLTSPHQTADELMKTVDFVAENTEELISDYTFWATYQLSKAAHEKGYKVMLSGMGGDEIFAGYPRYTVLKKHRLFKLMQPLLHLLLRQKIFPKKLEKKFERLVSYCSEKHWPTAYNRLLGYFSRADLECLFNNFSNLEQQYQVKLNGLLQIYQGSKKDKVKLAQHYDLYGFLAHNLTVSDKASMLASIELRVPLLAESIVAHGLSLPTRKLHKRGQLKYPLKQVLASCLPKQFTKRPKTGFNPPLDGLINTIGQQRLKDEIQEASKFINTDHVDSLLKQHFSGHANYTYKLWQLLYFSRWIKMVR